MVYIGVLGGSSVPSNTTSTEWSCLSRQSCLVCICIVKSSRGGEEAMRVDFDLFRFSLGSLGNKQLGFRVHMEVLLGGYETHDPWGIVDYGY